MKRIYLEDTQFDRDDTDIAEFIELVFGFAEETVGFAVDKKLDLNDAELLWHQAIVSGMLEAGLKLTFKTLSERE